MAWTMLPTNYTDAVWAGLKKYTEITNDDGTVSFQDVTQYSNRERSFFGAQDANRMNQALNTLMSMVENGTNLYEDFQNYFTVQQSQFQVQADNTFSGFTTYINGLKAQGDNLIETIQSDYRSEITSFEDTQEQVFNTWFNFIRGQLDGDIAGNLQNQLDINTARLELIESMCLTNDFVAPITTDDEDFTILTDDLGNAILADWKYKEE